MRNRRPSARGQPAWSVIETYYSKTATSGVLGDLEITEVGFARRGFVRPKHQHRAPVFGGVRTMLLAGHDVNRRAGKVFFSFINKITFHHVKCFGHPIMPVSRDYRARLHDDVYHNGSKRVIFVSDCEGYVALTLERKRTCLDFRGRNFLIVHVVLL